MKQIEPKELRIGNYVKSGNLHCYINCFLGKYSMDLEVIGFDYTNDNHEANINDIEPIELTPEWLVNFGFAYKQRSSEYFNHKYYFKEIGNNNGNKKYVEVTILESGHSEVTKYEVRLIHEYRWGDIKEARVFWSNELNVHTLQNLVFALSGNDLEIK